MPTVWNAADGRLWAAEFASGAELVERMSGRWLSGQPGIDEVTRAAVADAVRAHAAAIRGGSGPQTAVITSGSARAGALRFAGELSTYDGTLAEVLAQFHPRYVAARAAQPVPAPSTLGGVKHGAAREWAVDRANGTTGPATAPRVDLGPVKTAVGAVAVVALVVVVALNLDAAIAIWNTLLRIFTVAIVILLLVRIRRWMQG